MKSAVTFACVGFALLCVGCNNPSSTEAPTKQPRIAQTQDERAVKIPPVDPKLVAPATKPRPVARKFIEATEGQLFAAKAAFAKLNAEYSVSFEPVEGDDPAEPPGLDQPPVPKPEATRKVHVFQMTRLARDADMEQFRTLPVIPFSFKLDFANSLVTGAGLKELKGVKNLYDLHIDSWQKDDAGLKALRELGMLHILSGDLTVKKRPTTPDEVTRLQIGCPRLTNDGLKELKDFRNLTSLMLYNSRVTDAGLQELKDFPYLSDLTLSELRITDEGLKELKDLKNLSTLSLHKLEVTDAGLKELKDCKKLSVLDVEVTDGALKTLREIDMLHVLSVAFGNDSRPTKTEEITSLRLDRSKVTDAGLQELTHLKNLTELNLWETGVTIAAIEKLRKVLPRCEIKYFHPPMGPKNP